MQLLLFWSSLFFLCCLQAPAVHGFLFVCFVYMLYALGEQGINLWAYNSSRQGCSMWLKDLQAMCAS